MGGWTVYMPAEGSALEGIFEPGTGIVGRPVGERIQIDYEKPGPAVNVVTFADRCYHAQSRQEHNYPTSKRMWASPDELTAVATFHLPEKRVEVANATQLVALAKWLGLWVWADAHFDSDELHRQLRPDGGRR